MQDASMHSGRILLVDDLALFRRVLPARLGPLGRMMDSVPSVAAARDYLENGLPSLILLDVIMPDVDGLSFCRELKASPQWAHIPVIILTDVRADIYEQCMGVGADDYMPKRMDDAIMRIRIQLMLHLQERRRGSREAWKHSEGNIVVATPSPMLRAQLPVQLQPRTTRVFSNIEELNQGVIPEDHMLLLDMDLGASEIHERMTLLRTDPELSALPIMLLCTQDQLRELSSFEFMVDDVLWKPMNAQITRHRVEFLLELGYLTRGNVFV